jgi:hypothetical protein
VACSLEQQRGNRRVDAARHPDDDALRHIRSRIRRAETRARR